MNSSNYCRRLLLIAVIFGLFALAPLGLVSDLNGYFQSSTAPINIILQSGLKFNLARPNFDYPGELLLAVNLVPAVDYFGDALKPISLNGIKTQDFKVIGTSRQLILVSVIILWFYIFYRNSRTSSEEDPFLLFDF
ncbi:MAG TPA: hypothetical protein VIM29_03755 [Bacillota bacterium]